MADGIDDRRAYECRGKCLANLTVLTSAESPQTDRWFQGRSG
jgi:hypothetical protein